MKSYNDSRGPRIVTVTLASGLSEYLLRTQELGAVEGTDGTLALNPLLTPVLEALHHVLAGGEVSITIVHQGHPDLVTELNQRAEQSMQEATILNRTAGYFLSATV